MTILKQLRNKLMEMGWWLQRNINCRIFWNKPVVWLFDKHLLIWTGEYKLIPAIVAEVPNELFDLWYDFMKDETSCATDFKDCIRLSALASLLDDLDIPFKLKYVPEEVSE